MFTVGAVFLHGLFDFGDFLVVVFFRVGFVEDVVFFVLEEKAAEAVFAVEEVFAVFEVSVVVAEITIIAVVDLDGAHDFVTEFAAEVDVGAVDAVAAFDRGGHVEAVLKLFVVEAMEAVLGVVKVVAGAVFVVGDVGVKAGCFLLEFLEGLGGFGDEEAVFSGQFGDLFGVFFFWAGFVEDMEFFIAEAHAAETVLAGFAVVAMGAVAAGGAVLTEIAPIAVFAV